MHEILRCIRNVLPLSVTKVVLALHILGEDLVRAISSEQRPTSQHDIEDDTDTEDISLAIVAFLLKELRRDITRTSTSEVEFLGRVFYDSRQTEVCNLQIKLIVDQNILEFQVAVHDTHLVHVFDGIEELMDEKAASIFPHCAHCLTKVKKKPTWDVLHHDVDEVADAAPRRLANLPTVAVALHRYDVVMTHVLEDRDLVVHGPNALFIAVEELLFQDFDCCKSSIFYMPTEVDFGGVTLSEALDHLILSVKNRVCFSRLHCHAS